MQVIGVMLGVGAVWLGVRGLAWVWRVISPDAGSATVARGDEADAYDDLDELEMIEMLEAFEQGAITITLDITITVNDGQGADPQAGTDAPRSGIN